jgi:predicted CXXCH cytochrome family protein
MGLCNNGRHNFPVFENPVPMRGLRMLKRTRPRLWMAVCVLAMTSLAIALSGQSQNGAGTGQPQAQNADRQKVKKKDAATMKQPDQPVDPSQYVGSDTCKTCHEPEAAGYDQGPHWKTALAKHTGPERQGCEACHGPGKAHAESGDPDKIIRFGSLSREESSRRCLGCHEFGEEHANFLRSPHLLNNVGCVDCHSVHSPKVNRQLLKAAQPALCYSCHLEVKPSFAKPYHHRVNEGLTGACSQAKGPALSVWQPKAYLVLGRGGAQLLGKESSVLVVTVTATDQRTRASVSFFVVGRSEVVGEGPDSPEGGHVESKRIAETDPEEAETCQFISDCF